MTISDPIEVKTSKAKKMMLWFGLISITMTFAGLTSAFIVSSSRPDWLDSFVLPVWFTISTVSIALSSLFFQLAKYKLDQYIRVSLPENINIYIHRNNVNIFLGQIIIEDTNKSEDVFDNTVQVRISEGQDADLFRIDGRDLYLIGGLDYEENKEHYFTIKATNDKGIESQKTIKLIVNDIPNSSTRSSFNILVFNVQNEQEDSKVNYKRYYNPKIEDRGVGKWKIKRKSSIKR